MEPGGSSLGKRANRMPSPPRVGDFSKDPRFLTLPKERQMDYRRARQLYEQYGRALHVSPTEQARRDALWHQAMILFLGMPQPVFEQYAKDPDTFPAERFALSHLISNTRAAHDPREAYANRDGVAPEPLSTMLINLDGPLGFAIVHKAKFTTLMSVKQPDGSTVNTSVEQEAWEPISVLGFTIDLGANILLVDQLQGGSTDYTPGAEDGRRARMKLTTPPEELLYNRARDLAKRLKLRGIGLRKPEANMWETVRTPAKRGKSTLYERFAKTQKLRAFASKEYYFEAF